MSLIQLRCNPNITVTKNLYIFVHAVIQRILWLWYQTQQHYISIHVGSISLFYVPTPVPYPKYTMTIFTYMILSFIHPSNSLFARWAVVSCSIFLAAHVFLYLVQWNVVTLGLEACCWCAHGFFLMLLIPTIKTNKIKIMNAASQSPFELVLPCQRTPSRRNKVESCSLSATCSPNTSAAKASPHLHIRVLTICCWWFFVCLFFKYRLALALMSFRETLLDPILNNETTLRAWS